MTCVWCADARTYAHLVKHCGTSGFERIWIDTENVCNTKRISPPDIKRSVSMALAHHIKRMEVHSKDVSFTPKKGWFGGEKTEVISGKNCKLYEMSGWSYASVKRACIGHKPPNRRPLRPEGVGYLTFEEYAKGAEEFTSEKEEEEKILAKSKSKSKSKSKNKPRKGGMLFPDEKLSMSKRSFGAGTVWMADSFEVSMTDLLPILSVLAPHNKHFKKMEDFVHMRLPGGKNAFPLKAEIPVVPTVSGTFCFGDYELKGQGEIDVGLFDIPPQDTWVKELTVFKPKRTGGENGQDGEEDSMLTTVGPEEDTFDVDESE